MTKIISLSQFHLKRISFLPIYKGGFLEKRVWSGKNRIGLLKSFLAIKLYLKTSFVRMLFYNVFKWLCLTVKVSDYLCFEAENLM